MSVGPDSLASSPLRAGTAVSLAGAEGELLAVRISVEPRLLEKLLDTLAQLEFPISPQIYHHAALRYVYPDGRDRWEPTTTVEFPAYAGWLPSLRRAVEEGGFQAASFAARSMLEDLSADCDIEPGPAGSPYRSVIWYRHTNGSPCGQG
jgi:hypothetical protein